MQARISATLGDQLYLVCENDDLNAIHECITLPKAEKSSYRGYEDVVRLLLERGANVDLKDVMGRTPVELAQAGKHEKLKALLTERSTVAR